MPLTSTEVGFIFIILVLLFFLFSLPSKTIAQAQSEADERSKEIERIKSEIQRIKEEQQKQIEELQKRIGELEAETQKEREKEYVEPSKPPKEVEEAPAKTYVIEWWKNIEVGYSNGFFIRTQDDLFSLKFNIRSQFLFFVEDEGDDTATSFDIRRLWISFRGNAFRPWFKYLLILEASGDVELLDYFMDAAKITAVVPRAGQYRVPFNREELTDPFNLQLVDNSILNREFSLGRHIGVGLGGVGNRFVTYGVGVFNNAGRNSINENSNLLYVGRVMFTPTGEPRYSSINPFPVSGEYAYSQGSFGDTETPLIAISAAVAFLPGYKPVNDSPDNVVINNRMFALGSDKSNIFQFSADISVKYSIFSLEAEYDLRNINPDEAGIDSALSQGVRVQSGVFLIPKLIEVAGRFAIIDLGNDFGDDKIWEITPGLSFYFIKNHNLKLQFDYSFIRDELLDTDINRARAQLTVSF
ncbi:MAG TPA: porin [Thermodesulfobacteriota bacterium]|nr:porin [Thermodesulfobacteriota bacterium]